MSGLGVVPGRCSLRETPSHGTQPLSQPRIALKSRKRYVKIRVGAGCRAWALFASRNAQSRHPSPFPAKNCPEVTKYGVQFTGWRPFMGSAHTRHNRQKRHGLAMLATFMGSAHTRLISPERSRAGARSWALPIPAIIGRNVTGSLCSPRSWALPIPA